MDARKNKTEMSFMMILQRVDGLCIDLRGNTINLRNQDCHWATYISRFTSVHALRIGPNVPVGGVNIDIVINLQTIECSAFNASKPRMRGRIMPEVNRRCTYIVPHC